MSVKSTTQMTKAELLDVINEKNILQTLKNVVRYLFMAP